MKSILLVVAMLISIATVAQDSNVNNFLRDRLMVYYVEDPSTDQYRLLRPDELSSGQNLFGGNPEMEIAQSLLGQIFSPSSDTAVQETVIMALRRYDRPLALFLYHDRGPLDEAVASANWTNCIDNSHFTSCVTVEDGDEYAAIVHYGSNQMNADGLTTAQNRLLSLLGAGENPHDPGIEEGIVLTFYTNYVRAGTSFNQGSHDEFERYAKRFSQQHNAVGLSGNTIITGENAAVPILTVEDIVNNATTILNRLRSERGNPNLRIGTLAILTHGLTDYVNFGNRNFIAINETVAEQKNGGNPPDAYETAETFAAAMEPLLSSQAKLILYACLSGSSVTDEIWNSRTRADMRSKEEDYASIGEGSVGKALKNYLNANGSDRQVWAHRTTAHTVGNPSWRVFKGPNTNGRPYEDLPFFQHHPIFSDKGTQYLARLVKARLDELNAGDVTQEVIRIWIGQEIPFVSSAIWPLVTEEPERYNRAADYHFQDGLVELYARRWIAQNPSSL